MNCKIALSILALAATAATSATASSIEFKGFAYESNPAVSSYPVTITLPYMKALEVHAGGYITSVDSGPSFISYCIDLGQQLQFNAPPYTNYTSSANGMLPTSTVQALGGLFAANVNQVASPLTAAAMQLAVWEVVYENSSQYNVTTGSTKFAADVALQVQANQFLSNITLTTIPLQFFNSSSHQDVVTAIPLSIPEPATSLLMAMGIGAFCWSKLSRKAVK